METKQMERYTCEGGGGSLASGGLVNMVGPSYEIAWEGD